MRGTLRALSAVLAGALLSVTVVAFSPGDEPEAKATLGPLQAVTVTAADFHPTTPSSSYWNNGYYLQFQEVLARIPFPEEVVVLTSVRVRVYDHHESSVCVTLSRARPGDAAEDWWGVACTEGESATDPQTLSIAAFERVGRFHSAYLLAQTSVKHDDLRLYGATVFYRVVS